MRTVTDRQLRRWLDTGRPRRIEQIFERPDIAERLDCMTRLDPGAVDLLARLTSPPPGLDERLESAIEGRMSGETWAALVDLLGLGWHAASAVIDLEDR